MKPLFRSLCLAMLVMIAAAVAGLPSPGRAIAAPAGPTPPLQRPKFASITEMVALTVAVTDQQGRPIHGLKQDDFVVYDDDVPQEVRVFSSDVVPVSWGLVLDRSGSMAGMIDEVYNASLHAMDMASPPDEGFVATFSNSVTLEHDFTTDRHALQNAVAGLRAQGGTALWDAVADGAERLARGTHRKKVLLVVTDGDDNDSRRRFSDVLSAVERTDVIVYAVGLSESRRFLSWGSGMDRTLQQTLTRLTRATGGAAHFPDNMKKCREVMSAIAQEVHAQYLLGYDPPGSRDGEWHQLRVEIRPATGGGLRTARTREGYYHGPPAHQAER